MADLTGTTLGKYRLIERLGRGGMAQVYRAYQSGLDRDVAIKLMHGYLAEDEDFVGRFQREAKAIAALHHPHIVQVHDFDIEGDVYYMVQEYVEGGTLKARLHQANQEHKTFTIQETVRILTAICSAVDYAHEQGRVHRDIKPDNIMFGQHDRPVLTDFGIASIVGGARFTATGAMVGTPAYMSPEQGKGYPGDARSDVYSLGVVLYEMVTGRIPFDADTPLAVVLKHVNEPLPLPRSLNPDVPYQVERIILKALAKEPDDRFQTARELAQALEEAVSVEETPVWDIPPIEPALPSEAILPVVEDTAGSQVVLTETPTQEPSTSLVEESAPEKQTPAPKRRWWVWALGGVAALVLLSCCTLGGLRILGNLQSQRATAQTPDVGKDRREAVAAEPPVTQPGAAIPPAIQDLVSNGYDALGEQCEGDSDAALALFEQAIAQAPDAAAGYVGRARYYTCHGQHEPALADLEAALERDANYAPAYYWRGMIWYWQEKGQEAVNDFSRAIELDPRYVQAYYHRGLAHEWPLEDYERALADMNIVIGLDPGFAPAYLSRGQLNLWFRDDPQAALADFGTLIELRPDDARGYAERGYVYLELLEEYEQAIAEYTLAIERDPTDTSLYFQRASAHWKLGNADAATKDLDQAIEIEPSPRLYFHRGMAHYASERYAAALQDFDKVLLLGWDEEGAAHHAKGWVYFKQKEYEKAIEAYSTAATYDLDSYRWPFFGESHPILDRAIAYRANGQLDESLADLNTLLEERDDWALAYFHRGLTYAAMGLMQEARQDLRQAWEYTSNEGLRARIEEALRKLPAE